MLPCYGSQFKFFAMATFWPLNSSHNSCNDPLNYGAYWGKFFYLISKWSDLLVDLADDEMGLEKY